MDGDVAQLVIQDLIITNWATFSTGDGLGEAFPVGLDGAQGVMPNSSLSLKLNDCSLKILLAF